MSNETGKEIWEHWAEDGFLYAKDRIAELETNHQRLKEIEEAARRYTSEAWHHASCPRYTGNDYLACNCGYADLLEALQGEEEG